MDYCEMAAQSNDYQEYILTNRRADTINLPTECIKRLIGDYSILYVNKEIAGETNIQKDSYTAIPKCYSIQGEDALLDSGILSVQNQPFLNLKGRGVVIGIIDTGIDYQNPAFRNPDGSTRILSIWDQTAPSAEQMPPEVEKEYQREIGDVWYDGILSEEIFRDGMTGESENDGVNYRRTDAGRTSGERFTTDVGRTSGERLTTDAGRTSGERLTTDVGRTSGERLMTDAGIVHYGRIYNKEEIDRALRSDSPLDIVPVTDENGHGTRVAQIAAGSLEYQGDVLQYQNRFLDEYLGAAPEASLVIVKLKEAKQYLKDFYQIREGAVCFQETDILCAVNYLERIALDEDVPMVIGIALGTNQGDHSGRSPLGNTLNRISSEVGFAVVGGSGNEGNKRHHYRGVTSVEENYQDVEIRVARQTKGFALEIWGEIPTVYTVEILSPSGERIPRLPVRIEQSERFRFVFDGTDLQIDFRLVSMMEGAELIFMRFLNPSDGIWNIRVYGSGTRNGTFDIWLPLTDFMEGDTYFMEPEANLTLTEPFCAENTLCAGSYNALTDGINISSGRGFTRLGSVKPDVAAAEDSYGSSGSTALAMGAAALMMEWGLVRGNDNLMDGIKIRNYFILGAGRSGLMEYPNPSWGYGMLNIYETLRALQIR